MRAWLERLRADPRTPLAALYAPVLAVMVWRLWAFAVYVAVRLGEPHAIMWQEPVFHRSALQAAAGGRSIRVRAPTTWAASTRRAWTW